MKSLVITEITRKLRMQIEKSAAMLLSSRDPTSRFISIIFFVCQENKIMFQEKKQTDKNPQEPESLAVL